MDNVYKIVSEFSEPCQINGKASRRYYYHIKNEFGLCKIQKSHFKSGRKPSILSALNKTEYFKNMANKIHNFKFDYCDVEYVNIKTKINITSMTKLGRANALLFYYKKLLLSY